FEDEGAFSYIHLPYSLGFKKQKNLDFYNVKTSFTKLMYANAISGHNFFSGVHAQHYKGMTAIVGLNGFLSAGTRADDFENQSTNFFSLDATIHYEIPSKIYGFKVSYILNRLKMGENGGLADLRDTTLERFDYFYFLYPPKKHNPSDFLVENSNAKSNIINHDLLFQQFVKLQVQNKDFNLGYIVHSFQYKSFNINYQNPWFKDSLGLTTFYPTDTLVDSLRFYSIVNTLQWSSFKPFAELPNQKYFFHIAGGITHEYTQNRYSRNQNNSFTLFARTAIRLFSVTDINVEFLYSFLGYLHNNATVKGEMKWAIKRSKEHYLGVTADYYRISPDYFFTKYQGVQYRWDTTLQKQNVMKLSAYWTYNKLYASVNYFLLNRYLVLDENVKPYATEGFSSIIQLQVFTPVKIKDFGFNTTLCLQYSGNEYVPVPLFAGKATIYYIFRLVKKRLQLQLGVDMMYNTYCGADAYVPSIHQYRHQKYVETGNYFYLGAYLNLKIKRVGIFLRLDNPLAGIVGNHYFTTPYYPMQGLKFSFGVTWRFYD
ncbi:MAG: putative porin, partial [Bacteroidales bacterium]|nr:putative porin [Bacteroidales bacterium]